ncbi:MAG: PAS domain-containing protein [Geminocystis sp.]|nr:PAS domain-containing protein [Geminocystis sp.]HIK37161.1 PAS domain-containing protein [Geminocystis sp. M7585_C2015_104]MCS7148448.1 PAS domain-containing protein [Geminocystis sp.]MCX8078237.1 PAS domain-containing protein [Geminocystis sp.]MDW8115965.1 PAS domain-containing protein [Geminocystis sp.]
MRLVFVNCYNLSQGEGNYPISNQLSSSRWQSILVLRGKQLFLAIANDIIKRLKEGSGKRFQTMADNAPVLIWLANKDSNRIYLNKARLDFIGKTPTEETNGGWINRIHPSDVDLYLQSCHKSFQ